MSRNRATSYYRVALKQQQGIALFMVIMVTLIIITLSVSIATGVFGEYKNTLSATDQAIARQGAEAALRDAELDIQGKLWNGSSFVDGNTRGLGAASIEACEQLGNAGVNQTCSLGMVSMPLSINGSMPTPTDFNACSTLFGSVTQQANMTMSGQLVTPTLPRYSIEVFSHQPAGAKNATPIYRIRARGFGRNKLSMVDLESIYRPCN